MQNYRKLKVWQKSHQVVLNVYRLTQSFRSDEGFGLTGQIRRSASSIPANIVEGSERGSDADYARFLYIALGSTAELDYHLLLANDLGFIDETAYLSIAKDIDEVDRMVNGFIRHLKK